MARNMKGFGAPQNYQAVTRFGVLGGGVRYAVNMNGHTDKAFFSTLSEAQRDAAKRNYREGTYTAPRKLGLDGVD